MFKEGFDNAVFNYQEWKKRRKYTIIAMLMVNLVGGIDMSIVLATLIPYLKNSIKVENTDAYFAFITTSFCISSALFGAASGRIVDRTRRFKVFTSVTLVFQIVGNLIYTIPYSPLFPLFGRLIAGAGEAFTSVCIGEVIRIYDNEGSNRVICWLATTSSFGYVIGPLLSAPLAYIRFSIGHISIDGYNIVGLVIAALCTLTLVVCQFLVHDCSKEFDMKSHLVTYSLSEEPKGVQIFGYSKLEDDTSLSEDHCAEDLMNCDETCTDQTDEGTSSILQIVKSLDQCLILAFSFLVMYIIASGETLIPLISYQIMNWKLSATVWTLSGYGTVLIVVSLVIGKMYVSHRSMYLIGYISIPSIILGYSALLYISLAERNQIDDVVCISIYVLCLVFSWFLESIALRSMYGKTVTSELQSVAEAVRNGISRFGMILSSFVTPFMIRHLTIYSSLFVVIGTLMLLMYFSRRKSLSK